MTTPQTITSEIQKLAPSAIVELYILDASSLGAGIFYFHAGTNQLSQNVIWQGQEYVRLPILASGFEYSGMGSLPRPKMSIANSLSAISLLLIQFQDLLGAKLTRKRTLAKYMDAVNFPGGVNPQADPLAEFADEVFYVDRKSAENANVVEFELAASIDLVGVAVPRRQIVQNVCTWRYRGEGCGYGDTRYFTTNDQSTADPLKDVCGKRLSSCKLRFISGDLPFGGFPGADLYR